jgi:hypothetical protein
MVVLVVVRVVWAALIMELELQTKALTVAILQLFRFIKVAVAVLAR